MSDRLYSVKMRASRGGVHVSGAERIVEGRKIAATADALARRVAVPFDFMNIKVEAAGDALRLPALRVASREVSAPAEGWAEAERILRAAGFSRVSEIAALFSQTYSMRGAMLLDADTLERLEPDRERGIRATVMDSSPSSSAAVKNHFAEALTLATKVQAAPGIVGEICVSDDPGYVTGYVAAGGVYYRISRLKEPGSPCGGRIFLYRGPREDVAKTIDFLEKSPVIVELGDEMARALPARRDERRFEGIEEDLAALDAAGLRRVIRGGGGDNGKICFASNDYLGLSRDERVKNAAAKAALVFGAGSGASRLVTGTLPPHVALERHIAAFTGCEDAIVFSAGYMANVGAITAFAGRGDVVLSDELNHASIIDGCRLSGAEVQVYRHLDMADLEARLAQCSSFRRRLVVSDGVFSMDGDTLDFSLFVAICRRFDAFSMVDCAHVVASGNVFETKPDLTMGTLSKFLGSMGGYVAGSSMAVEYLRQKARPFIFSTAPAPAVVAAADAALGIIETEPWRVDLLRENARLFRNALGLPHSPGDEFSAIVPILVGDERAALAASATLSNAGFDIPAIRYPTVAHGQARLRVAISASHAKSQLLAAAAAISTCVNSR